ncbi:hypothetical protein IM793_05950 [Pedobacter sp. MR2016-19]|uniref:MAC/perforin domain-containing protein n=1 Tax=Pedobacter sp. MR2016-19 TaxID=2780089 RepID=UPI0018741409|nr:MAC/perforin domain-containing protein [Pedobacter sp. MR2016-19]MBE5318688.1 hypothetical protein [Pedobacter sp. MR2016-19]
MTTTDTKMLREQIEQSKPKDLILRSFNAFNPIIAKNPDLLLSQLHDHLRTPLSDSDINNQTAQEMYSSTFKEYQSSQSSNSEFAVSLGIEGSYGFYSGSVKASQHSETYKASTFFSSSYNAFINCGTVSLNQSSGDYKAIRAYLSIELCKRLDNITSLKEAVDFIQEYGTHLVLGINLGGCIRFKTESQTTDYKSKQETTLEVEAAYKGVSNISVAAKVSQKLSTASSSSSLMQTIEASGGKSSLVAVLDPNKPETSVEWANSCTSETCYGITSSLEIWRLAENDIAKDKLKEYIYLIILAQSINYPTIFTAETALSPYNLVSVTAVTGDSHFRIIGGGASVEKDKSSFLVNSYPQTDTTGKHINGWIAGSHDIAQPASNDEYLTSYAIAIYDPSYVAGSEKNLLEVQLQTKQGGNPNIGADAAVARIDQDYLISGGGIQSYTSRAIQKFIMRSYPSREGTWTAYNRDYQTAASDVTLTAYAIGIRSKRTELTIHQEFVNPPGVRAEYGEQIATLGDGFAIAGGGVSVKDATEEGNLVQQSFPASYNSWKEYNKDHDGRVSSAVSAAYAIGFKASLDFSK